MKPAVRFPLPLLALALLALPARAQTGWVEVRSPHFSVITDAGEKRGREVAQRFEQMRAVFGMLIQRKAVSIPIPVEVVAFRNNSGMRQFLPWYKGKPTEAVGLYLEGEARHFVLLDLTSEGGWPTTYYEFAHMLLGANYPPAQPWFDEGLAEYFSTVRVSNKEIRLGAPPEGLQDILKQKQLMPVTDLFSVNSRILQESGNHRLLFSSQSWLLVHYLVANRRLSQAGEYFDLVQNQNQPIPEAIRRAFAMEPSDFDRQLEAYRHGGQGKQVTFEPPAGVDSGGYQSAALDAASLKTAMAEVHLNSPDYKDQAIKEFEEVLATKPDHAPAHRGLGYAYLRKNQIDRAGEHFRRAALLSPDDPRVLYFSALLRSMSGEGGSDSAWEMKDQLTKSIAIDPESAGAHSLLAAVHMMTQDVESAIASIKTAIRLSPRNPAYQFSLGQYYMAAQRWDEAETLFRRLQQRSEPQLAAMAGDFLKRVANQRANPPALAARQVRPPDASADESPKWKRKKDAAAQPQPASGALLGEAPAAPDSTTSPEHEEEAQVPAAPDTRKIEFLRGRMLRVACEPGSQAAAISISSAGRTWKMHTRDREGLILINADQFSCSWAGQEVSVNYRTRGSAEGDLVSLEIRTLTQEPVRLKKRP